MSDNLTKLDETLNLIERLSTNINTPALALTNLKYVSDQIKKAKEQLYEERRVVETTFKTKFMVSKDGGGYWCPPSC